VQQSSWSKAARELGVSRAQLLQTISSLEHRLGVSLLEPTPSEVTLTEAGREFYQRTSAALESITRVEATLQGAAPEPYGKVRISAPVVLGLGYVAPLLGKLRSRYPDLAVELSLTDRFVDLIHEGVDLAIRVGAPFDSRLSTRRLCSNRRVLVAAPGYLEAQGTPQQPEELSEHECILFTPFTNQGQWRLKGPDGAKVVPVSGQLSTNNGYVLNNLAEQGLGITLGATLSLAPALLEGRLVRVLPQYEMEETSIFAAYPAQTEIPARVSRVIEFFADYLCDPPSWDQQLVGKVPGF
jgi:DNA-binding transcriptional LysR family regulator